MNLEQQLAETQQQLESLQNQLEFNQQLLDSSTAHEQQLQKDLAQTLTLVDSQASHLLLRKQYLCKTWDALNQLSQLVLSHCPELLGDVGQIKSETNWQRFSHLL